METRTPAEAKAELARILAAAGVTMTAKHLPTTYDPTSKEWQRVKWEVTIRSARGSFATEYSQGLGHLPNWPKCGQPQSFDDVADVNETLKTGKICKIGPSGNWFIKGKPLAPPELPDVMGSLLSDASAADYATFEEWARDMGDDPDSRRAETIFRACQQTALDLNRVVGAALVEQLRPIASEL
jgi:hypothetical protein